jgi:uncharacterized membrane protein
MSYSTIVKVVYWIFDVVLYVRAFKDRPGKKRLSPAAIRIYVAIHCALYCAALFSCFLIDVEHVRSSELISLMWWEVLMWIWILCMNPAIKLTRRRIITGVAAFVAVSAAAVVLNIVRTVDIELLLGPVIMLLLSSAALAMYGAIRIIRAERAERAELKKSEEANDPQELREGGDMNAQEELPKEGNGQSENAVKEGSEQSENAAKGAENS